MRSLSLSQALKTERLDSFAPSPFSARASAIRSRTCGRQRLAFLAASATGGARKPNPSEGAEAAAAASHRITKVRVAVKPAGAGCPHPSRCGTAPHRATFPKGKARAAAAAERRYCRCAYRRSFAAGGAKAVFPKGKGFSPHKFAVFVAPGRVFCYNTFNNTQNAQKGLFV